MILVLDHEQVCVLLNMALHETGGLGDLLDVFSVHHTHESDSFVLRLSMVEDGEDDPPDGEEGVPEPEYQTTEEDYRAIAQPVADSRRLVAVK